MTLIGESFLRILQDDSPVTFDCESSAVSVSRSISVIWDDEDSFEVSEVPNAASSDVTLAEALQTIDGENVRAENESVVEESSCESLQADSKDRNSLKDELRAKIQTRRRSEGIGDLCIQFDPPKSYPLSPEENEKVQKRKRRNRLSANKSRLKRKAQEELLQKEVDDLETEHNKLFKEVKFLQKIKSLLSSKIANHPCSTPETTSSHRVNINRHHSKEGRTNINKPEVTSSPMPAMNKNMQRIISMDKAEMTSSSMTV